MSRTGWNILALLNDLVYRYGDYDRMAIAMTLGLDSYFREKFTSLVPEGSSRTVLDLGAGTGRNVPFILRYVRPAQIVLLDLSSSGLKRAHLLFRGNPRIDIVCGSAELLPLKHESIDTIISSYMLRQVDLAKTLRELRYVLKRRGLVVLVDFWKSLSYMKTLALLVYLAVVVPLEALLLSPSSWHAYKRLWRELVKLPPPHQVTRILSKVFRKVRLLTFNNFIFVWVLSR